jgi:predicted esterase
MARTDQFFGPSGCHTDSARRQPARSRTESAVLTNSYRRPGLVTLTVACAVMFGLVASACGRASVRATPTPHAEAGGATASAPSSGTTPADPSKTYKANQVFFEADGLGQYENTPNAAHAGVNAYGGDFTSGYWINVPPSYDRNNRRSETLLVWLHGCQSIAHYDAEALTSMYTSNRPFILIVPSGPEAGDRGGGPSCWDTDDQNDVHKVLTDIRQTETEFNINPRRVIISGYSSGGELAYQTIFTHAKSFAGILAFNTDPVRGNTFDDSINRAIATAAWKFPIFQILHSSDTTFPPSSVIPKLKTLEAAGFSVKYKVLPGNHYDSDAPTGCDNPVPATCTSGTYYDIVHSLLPQVAADGWEAPAS